MKIDLVKLVEKVSEEENIQGGIHKIFALTCLQKLVDMQNESINYTHCCKSDSEQFTFADMRDAFDYASVSSQRRDGMTFKEWMSKR